MCLVNNLFCRVSVMMIIIINNTNIAAFFLMNCVLLMVR